MCEESTMTWIEFLYYVAGIVVALAATIGLTQIALLKKDIRLRNERASKEQAIVYAMRFLTQFAPHNETYRQALSKAKIEPYHGPIGDFSSASIPKEHQSAVAERLKIESWMLAVNELEAVASAYMSGVAHENQGFDIIGRMFCVAVKGNYDIIAACRADPAIRQYQNIVSLYGVWHARLTKAELKVQVTVVDETSKELRKQIAAQTDAGVRPLGT